MPSLDERREVAARLRERAKTARRVGYACVLKKCTSEEECDGFGIEGCEGCFNASLKRLADLIEPEERTCRIDTEESPFLNIQRWHICGNCGTGFSCWQYTEDGDEFEVEPTRCPNCEAKVVE